MVNHQGHHVVLFTIRWAIPKDHENTFLQEANETLKGLIKNLSDTPIEGLDLIALEIRG